MKKEQYDYLIDALVAKQYIYCAIRDIERNRNPKIDPRESVTVEFFKENCALKDRESHPFHLNNDVEMESFISNLKSKFLDKAEHKKTFVENTISRKVQDIFNICEGYDCFYMHAETNFETGVENLEIIIHGNKKPDKRRSFAIDEHFDIEEFSKLLEEKFFKLDNVFKEATNKGTIINKRALENVANLKSNPGTSEGRRGISTR
jgi:hypothetical protein